MHKIKALPAVLFFLVLCGSVYGQWGTGVSINFKNEHPELGFSFIVSRDLPFQYPAVGFGLRFDANLFKQEAGRVDYIERDFFLSAVSTFYPGAIQPYVSLGAGFGYLAAPDADSYTFLSNVTGGIRFEVIEPLYPFFEIRGVYYSIPMDRGDTDAMSFQWLAAAGIKIEF